MQPSKEQIENAARLVVGHVTQFPMQPPKVFIGDVDGIASCRDWQPWADTEAGRSDALVLLAAMVNRFHVMDGPTFHRLAHHEGYLNDALRSGNVPQIQAATFVAAAAIGAHIGEEGK